MNQQSRRLRPHRAAAVVLLAVLAVAGMTACDPGPDDPAGRANNAIQMYAPAKLRGTVPYRISVVNGETSYAWSDGRIQVSRGQFNDSWDHARFIALHEYGHLVAYRHGTKAYQGAPPAGFPAGGGNHAELWADCFATAMTGVTQWGTSGRSVCSPELARWTGNYIRFWHT